MGNGSVPIGPEYRRIVDFMLAEPHRWFTEDQLPGDNSGSRIASLVVAGIVDKRGSPNQGFAYHLDPFWYQAHKDLNVEERIDQ